MRGTGRRSVLNAASILRHNIGRERTLVPPLGAAIGVIPCRPPPGHLCGIRRPHSSWINHNQAEVTTTASRTRWYSRTAACESEDLFAKTRIHIQGGRYGSREYILLPSVVQFDGLDVGDAKVSAMIRKYRIASVRANRNILFGAQCFVRGDVGLIEACRPLVKAALVDAGEHGEQPQALAALDGLCDWVTSCLERGGQGSEALEQIVQKMEESEGDEAAALFEAVKAIATGKPRPGHTVLGAGTFRVGQPLWEMLAREFAEGGGGSGTAAEAELYRSCGMEVVGVEHLADTSQEYLRTAGGAMARLFLV